jgi:2-phospho-L-lactate guanylyltransferase
MSVWVIVPVKPLRLAKSRLASVLTPEQRQRFAETMLRHVLSVTRVVPQVTGTLVISRDNRVLTIAREYGAKTVQESGQPELNAALMRATHILHSWHSDSVLVLPADLPLIEPQDVTGIIRAAGYDYGSVVLSTDCYMILIYRKTSPISTASFVVGIMMLPCHCHRPSILFRLILNSASPRSKTG